MTIYGKGVHFDPGYVSQILCAAREEDGSLDGYPSELPVDLDLAYDVQQCSIERWKDVVVGWKVGGINSPQREIYGASRLAGPVFAGGLRRAGDGECVDMPVFRHGFAAVEAEVVIELGDVEGIDPAGLDLDSVWSCITGVFTGVEVASSPMPDINRIGPIAIVSDFGNNAGLVVGPPIDAHSADALALVAPRVTIDGEVVGHAPAPAGMDGPLGAVIFLLQLLRRRGIAVPPGTLVTTGAITGIHELTVGQGANIEFGEWGNLQLRMVGNAARA